jgi:hypothetical protein
MAKSKVKLEVVYGDIPLPEIKRGRTYKFPFDKLEVGQMFIIKGMARNALGPYKVYAERHLGRRYKTKKLPTGIGVWRVA